MLEEDTESKTTHLYSSMTRKDDQGWYHGSENEDVKYSARLFIINHIMSLIACMTRSPVYK